MGFTAGLRAFGIAAITAASIATVAAPSAAAATPAASTRVAAASTAAVRVVLVAEAQRGKRYAYGAAGPSAFDCSGLVRYAYTVAGVASRLGGGHSGYAMLAWARSHHRFSTSAPQLGDVVIYGNGAHAAIYIGRGLVVSALNPSQGIRITALHALGQRVTGYIHTGLAKTAAVAPVRHRAVAVRPRTVTRPHAASHPAASFVAAKGYTNLRAGASTASRLRGVAQPGTRMRYTGSVVHAGVRWDRVVWGRQVVWVRGDLVRAA